MPHQPYLSVVIPSYNESTNMKRGVLENVLNYLRAQNYEWEIILSDDGSTDGTVELLKKFAQQDTRIHVLENIHAGKAPTVTSGMCKAQGEWRLFTDFDQSTPISEIEKFWPHIEAGSEVVIGSREIEGARRDKEPLHRHIMGRGFNLLVQLLAVPGIYDTQCGFKLFSNTATNTLFPNLKVYGGQNPRADAFTGAFDVELLFLAKKIGFTITEVPIIWKHAKSDRVSPIKDSVRMLRDIIRIRFADLKGSYSSLRKSR